MTIKDGLYDKAKMAPSPNKGGYIKPRLIIVHDTAGGLDAAGSVAWLRNPQAKASAHFVVARDGTVTQLVSCSLKAWHAGVSSYNGVMNVNDFSVGIEIVNPGHMVASGASDARAGYGAIFSRKKYGIEECPAQSHLINGLNVQTHGPGLWMSYPQAQLDAVLALCLDLKDAYGITEVVPHWYIAPKRKVDTSPLFPLRWLQAKLEGRIGDTPELTEDVKVPDAPPFIRFTEPTLQRGAIATPKPTTILDGPGTILDENAVYVRPIGAGALRMWPSFFDNTIDVSPGHGPFRVVGQKSYAVEGVNIPTELQAVMLVWYKVSYWDNEAGGDKTGFLLSSSAEVV